MSAPATSDNIKHIHSASIFHRNDSEMCYLADDETVVLRVRSEKDNVEAMSVLYADRFSKTVETTPDGVFPPLFELPMKKAGSGLVYDYFEVRFKPGFPRVMYFFTASSGSEKKWINASGVYSCMPKTRNSSWNIPYMLHEEVYRVPSWAKSSVMYQIFPDSFATGKKSFIPREKMCIPYNDTHCETLHGGTLAGIIANIEYLAELGIDCLYLNPIFTAKSYHKYDTIDYKSIDPCLGTSEEFKILVQNCHEKGIRVILDGVFNHTSIYFFAFQDILKNQEKSSYADWYYGMRFPLKKGWDNEYATFGNVKAMPKLNTGNADVAAYFCNIGRYWIREYGIDGWRLDVANEIDHNFWRLFKKAVREAKSDAILIGEVWEDAQNWLIYDQFDSAMNYRFTDLCKELFAYGTMNAQEAAQTIVDMHMRYPWEVTCVQMNLLDSHDVSRFLSFCKNDIALLKSATILQMTLPGLPAVFAGGERGMSGKEEKEFRLPFTWDANDKLAQWFAALIRLRKDNRVFADGEIKFYTQNGNILVFSRSMDENQKTMIVAINLDCDEQPVRINTDGFTFSCVVAAKSGCIYDETGMLLFTS